MSNGGRSRRDAFLTMIAASDPALHAELVAMRSRDPQGYRKRVRTLSRRAGDEIDTLVALDLPYGYPGRARDTELERRASAIAVSTVSEVIPPAKVAAEVAAEVAAPSAPDAAPATEAPSEPAKAKKSPKKKPGG
jgi:hypothetical protein